MSRRPLRLLSVDWDYFCVGAPPESSALWALLEWSGSAAGSEQMHAAEDVIWHCRMGDLDRRGITRPQLVGVGGFWRRFRIKPSATLYYADSHASIAGEIVREGVGEIWSYDAHHDAGYGDDMWKYVHGPTCESWLLDYAVRGVRNLHVRYPAWRVYDPENSPPLVTDLDIVIDDGAALRVGFDRVYVCRSGGWSPPTFDAAFLAFLDAAPVRDRLQVGLLRERAWDERNIGRYADAMAAALVKLDPERAATFNHPYEEAL